MSNIYDDNAFFSAYEAMDRSQKGLEGAGEWYTLKTFFPDNLEGKTALDLGCGYGWHAKYLSSIKLDYIIAIDESEKMLEKAKKINSASNIAYINSSIENFSYPPDSFDFVLSNLALHYIENLDRVFKNVYVTLKNKGTFLFNIEHPLFTAGVNQDWIYDDKNKPLYFPINNYFFEGCRETWFLGNKVIKYHHTLENILMSLIKTGFKIKAVSEPKPNDKMLTIPGMVDELKRPSMLIIKCKK